MKSAVLDISENDREIGEKLFVLLDEVQQSKLTKYNVIIHFILHFLVLITIAAEYNIIS